MLAYIEAVTMRESDWKLFRELQRTALQRFCERVLGELSEIAVDSTRTPHERYLAVVELVRQRDSALADAFDNPRRSTAPLQLRTIYSKGLLTEEEFARFSSETRDAII